MTAAFATPTRGIRNYITATQLDVVAAHIRRRDRPDRAVYEWHQLSEADRQFWRRDITAALTAAGVTIVKGVPS